MPIIRQTVSSSSSRAFHYIPFYSYQTASSSGARQRIFDEPYSCDDWLEAHRELLSKFCRVPYAPIEIGIIALMFWSDSTHLAQFGTASLWPVYMFFGNESKYIRNKPTMHRCQHVAYLPSVRFTSILFSTFSFATFQLPPTFQDDYKAKFGYHASDAVITHCKRELLHEKFFKRQLEREARAHGQNCV